MALISFQACLAAGIIETYLVRTCDLGTVVMYAAFSEALMLDKRDARL